MADITITVTDTAGRTATAAASWASPTAFGASVDSTSDLTRWQEQTGRPLGVVRIFYPGALPATWTADPRLAALLPNTIVVLSFKLGAASAVAAFLGTRPAGQKVYCSYHHEPEDDIAKGAMTAVDYRAAWLFHGPAIRAAGCVPTLILMDWTLNPASGRTWRDYFQPGAVDCIGWDSYNPARKASPPTYTDYSTKILPPIRAVAAETGLPWGFAEFGSPIVGTDMQRQTWAATTRQALTGALWACWWDQQAGGFDNTATSPVMQAWAG